MNNDTFTEQLVTIKKDSKTLALQIFIWVAAILIIFGLFIQANPKMFFNF